MQKHVNFVDLVKSFPMNIYLQNLASIQKRTSLVQFANLTEESDNGSVSNLSTKFGCLGFRRAKVEVVQEALAGSGPRTRYSLHLLLRGFQRSSKSNRTIFDSKSAAS